MILKLIIKEELDNIENFDINHFKTLKSFNQRVKYCDERLKKISSGTSRIVYKINNKVLKLAKNTKGIVQNKNEGDKYIQEHYDHIIAKVFDHDENYFWLISEYVTPVRKRDFLTLYNINFNDYQDYIKIYDYEINSKKPPFDMDKDKKNILVNNEFVSDIIQFAFDVDLAFGDLERINSYGITKRNGKDIIVILDYGATNQTIEQYYK